jgi:vacuolar-type H+-ATPase catalytic subunit A/Vma1
MVAKGKIVWVSLTVKTDGMSSAKMYETVGVSDTNLLVRFLDCW